MHFVLLCFFHLDGQYKNYVCYFCFAVSIVSAFFYRRDFDFNLLTLKLQSVTNMIDDLIYQTLTFGGSGIYSRVKQCKF